MVSHKLTRISKVKSRLDFTHVFPGDGADVIHVLDIPLMLNHPHSNRILANLWSNVALDPEAEVFQHQVSYRDATAVKRRLRIRALSARQRRDELVFVHDWWTNLLRCRQRVRAPSVACAGQRGWRGKLDEAPVMKRETDRFQCQCSWRQLLQKPTSQPRAVQHVAGIMFK